MIPANDSMSGAVPSMFASGLVVSYPSNIKGIKHIEHFIYWKGLENWILDNFKVI